MAIVFDPASKRIILDTASVSATEIYSRWVDWAATSDNAKYGLVFRQVGSDDLGSGLSIPPYYFLQGNWRIRPMELDHDLSVVGNIFVETGESPIVRTLGSYQVNVRSTVAVQAQGINISGGSSPTVEEVASAVWAAVSRTLTSVSSVTTPAEVWAYADRQLTVAAGLTPSQEAKLTAIPTNPLLTTDVRLTRLDANISSITGYTPAQIWSYTARVLTETAPTDLTPVISAIAALNDITAAEVEAAILNEADGTTILNAIVTAIGNTNVNEVALVAAIRTDIERIGGMLANTPSNVWSTAARSLSSPSGLTSTQEAKLDALPINTLLTSDIRLNHLDTDISSLIGSSSLNSTQNAKLMSLGTPTEVVTELMATPLPISPVANTFGDLVKNRILTLFRFNTYK